MFSNMLRFNGIVTSGIKSAMSLLTTLLLLLTICNCAQAQFKIIGLLSDAATATVTPRAASASAAAVHPLDTSSPLVKIDAFEAPDTDVDSDVVGFGGENAARAFGGSSDELQQLNNKSVALVADDLAVVRKEIIKVRIMDETHPEQPLDNDNDSNVIRKSIDRNAAAADAVSSELTGIAVLMDKQARLYASKQQYQATVNIICPLIVPLFARVLQTAQHSYVYVRRKAQLSQDRSQYVGHPRR